MKHGYPKNHVVRVPGVAPVRQITTAYSEMNRVHILVFAFWVPHCYSLGTQMGTFLGTCGIFPNPFASSGFQSYYVSCWGSTVICHLKKGKSCSDPDLGLDITCLSRCHLHTMEDETSNFSHPRQRKIWRSFPPLATSGVKNPATVRVFRLRFLALFLLISLPISSPLFSSFFTFLSAYFYMFLSLVFAPCFWTFFHPVILAFAGTIYLYLVYLMKHATIINT